MRHNKTYILFLRVAVLFQFSLSFSHRSFLTSVPHHQKIIQSRHFLVGANKENDNTMSSTTSLSIRDVVASDVENLKKVVDSSELFPSEMLDDMISGYLAGTEDCLWLTADSSTAKDDDNHSALIAYCAPEKMTEGTWNLYLIAVHKKLQGTGIGSQTLKYLEEQLVAKKGCRILLVETSGLPEFGMFYCHFFFCASLPFIVFLLSFFLHESAFCM